MPDPREWMPGVPAGIRRDKAFFIRYLRETLIPDLETSGFIATAEDFATAARYILHPWTRDARDFVSYLRGTLIPDLRESGYEYTAEDFEAAADFIEY